jgi:benzodiazapine receptor
MKIKNQNYLSLTIWIVALLLIGWLLGSVTKAEVNTWYSTINRSSLTPPSYMFGIAWTILYILIAISGWIIWQKKFQNLSAIKNLYIAQLLLNWSWTPLFFLYHLTGLSLISLLVMNVLVTVIIYKSYAKMKLVSLLMTPYLMWILFAAYLNFYIWQHIAAGFEESSSLSSCNLNLQ